MSTMAENVIAARAENRPPMLERIAKEIWDRVKLLIEGSELSLQERESKLYNEFDRFTSKNGETIHSYYLRCAKLINDMNTIGMTMQKLQVNTMFVNNLQSECSKFVTDVKLAKDMHNASFDQLYAYLRQHEVHANEVRMMRQIFPDPLALVANTHTPTPFYNTQQYNQPHYNQQFPAFTQQQQFYSPPPPQQSYETPAVHHQSYEAPIFHQQPYQAPAIHHQSLAVFPQLDSSLVVPKFLPTDDPIESLNKAMTFLSITITSRYPQTNNQLRTLSNPRNQATIQDGRGKAIGTRVVKNTGNVATNQSRVIRCYNCRGLDALALTTTAIFQTDDIDAFNLDCDKMPTSSAVFMENLCAYDSDVLSKVPNHDTYQDNNVIDQSVLEMQYSKQPVFVDDSNIDITSESNVISYNQYMKENKSEVVQDTTSSEQQDAMIMSVIEEMSNQVAKYNAVNKENKALDLQPLFPKHKKNREAYVDYLIQTKEHADTLRELVEQARALKLFDNALDYACKFTTPIQELLVYVSATCPSSRNDSENLVDVTPMKRNRQVTFEKTNQVQVHLNVTVRIIRTYNGTKFVNQTLKGYYEDVGITYQTSVVITPQQNDVVKDLGKLKPKADIDIFIGYSPAKKAYRIYNKWTRLIMETIHVKFDELRAMAS
ncbi:integrase, catalytic region, zinc finger, CCHC-type containing protein [Tanacetum coccineum]